MVRRLTLRDGAHARTAQPAAATPRLLMTALAVIGVGLGWPTVLLAATPDGGVAGGPTAEPTLGGWLGGLLGVALALGAWAMGVVVLAFVVSRIGTVAEPGPSGRSRAAPIATIWVPSSVGTGATALLLWAPATILGLRAGRDIARYASLGGFSVVGGAIIGVGLAALALSMLAVAGIARWMRRGFTRAIAVVVVSAAILPAAALAGGLSGALTGTLERDPIALEGSGSVDLTLDLAPGDVAFTPDGSAPAECRSVPDGRGVQTVTALRTGEIGAATLRLGLSLGTNEAGDASVSLVPDGGPVPDEAASYRWIGSGSVASTTSDGMSGTVVFTGLSLGSDADKPGSASLPPEVALMWPTSMAGTLTWSCAPWRE